MNGARWMLVGVVLAALALRTGWGLTRTLDVVALPDQREYLEIGRSVVAGEGMKFFDARVRDVVWAFRAPGYPLFVAAFHADVRAVRGAQAALGAMTVLAAWVLASRFVGERWALAAALLVAVNPFLVYFDGLILSESVFTALVAWGMVLMMGRGWGLGVLLMALSVLVRPGAVGLPVMMSLLAALTNRGLAGAYKGRWGIGPGAAAVALTVLVLLPWGWRNYRVLGKWVWLSTNGGFTLYDGFNPDANGASDQRFVEQMPQLRRMNETARNEYLRGRAMDFVRDDPAAAVRLGGAKLARTWSPRPLSAEFSRPLYVAAAWTFALPFFALVLAGIVYGTLSGWGKAFLLGPAVYVSVTAMIGVGSLRYRIPAEVPMAVVAAAGARKLAEALRAAPAAVGEAQTNG